jgi:hypothetical protein
MTAYVPAGAALAIDCGIVLAPTSACRLCRLARIGKGTLSPLTDD